MSPAKMVDRITKTCTVRYKMSHSRFLLWFWFTAWWLLPHLPTCTYVTNLIAIHLRHTPRVMMWGIFVLLRLGMREDRGHLSWTIMRLIIHSLTSGTSFYLMSTSCLSFITNVSSHTCYSLKCLIENQLSGQVLGLCSEGDGFLYAHGELDIYFENKSI